MKSAVAYRQQRRLAFSHTLERIVQAGIASFRDRPYRTRVLALIASRVHLDIDLAGHRSAVAVEEARWVIKTVADSQLLIAGFIGYARKEPTNSKARLPAPTFERRWEEMPAEQFITNRIVSEVL
jgi:hypothetical protein